MNFLNLINLYLDNNYQIKTKVLQYQKLKKFGTKQGQIC